MKPYSWRHCLTDYVALVLLVLGLLLLAAPARGDDDSRRITPMDLTLEAVYVGGAVVDWGQTRWIARHPDRAGGEESNPILGKHPGVGKVDSYFAASLVLHAAISYAIPHGIWRTAWQAMTIAVETDCVVTNYKIGVGFSFP